MSIKNLTKEEKGAWLDPANATAHAKEVRLQWEKEELFSRVSSYKKFGGTDVLKAAVNWLKECDEGWASPPFKNQTYTYAYTGDMASEKYLELKAEEELAEKNRMEICERLRAIELETIATSSNPNIAKLELAVRETELNATRTRIVMAMFGAMLSKK